MIDPADLIAFLEESGHDTKESDQAHYTVACLISAEYNARSMCSFHSACMYRCLNLYNKSH
jgi:hypothetical protein